MMDEVDDSSSSIRRTFNEKLWAEVRTRWDGMVRSKKIEDVGIRCLCWVSLEIVRSNCSLERRNET